MRQLLRVLMGVYCLAAPAFAQTSVPIELRALDGSTAIQGQLVEIDDDFFVIDTVIGRLRVRADTVECVGVFCPVVQVAERSFGIHGSRTVGTTLVPSLLSGWAASFGGRVEITPTDDPAARIVRVFDADGSERIEIDLQTRGSGSAFPGLISGDAAIGVADRRLRNSDLDKLIEAGLPDLRDTPNEVLIGLDGIAMIVNPANPIRNLSGDQIARIWSGEITNWRELGGGDVPITVHTYGEGSGDRAIVLDRLVRPFGRDETANVVRHGPYQDNVDAVIADPGAIGFVGRWLALTNDVKLLDIREQCGLLSPPSDFRMKIEGYTLSRRLYAYTLPGNIHPQAQEFLDFVVSDAAQPYIAAANFIDRGLERMQLQDMGMALIHNAAVEPDFSGPQFSQMMRELRFADRLSTTFRFRTASAVLDVESQRELRDLARSIQGGEFDGLEVLLVGFADSIGDPVRNSQLALQRAETVRRLLEEALPFVATARLGLVPLSFGEQMPLSCNDTELGRERNRRVEVWVRVPSQG